MLNADLRRDGDSFIEEFRRAGVAPFGPCGQCWKAIANFVQENIPVDRIEGIFEINRNEDFVGVLLVAVKPLRGSLGADFSAQRGGDTIWSGQK